MFWPHGSFPTGPLTLLWPLSEQSDHVPIYPELGSAQELCEGLDRVGLGLDLDPSSQEAEGPWAGPPQHWILGN